jgi:hypothetical protein
VCVYLGIFIVCITDLFMIYDTTGVYIYVILYLSMVISILFYVYIVSMVYL